MRLSPWLQRNKLWKRYVKYLFVCLSVCLSVCLYVLTFYWSQQSSSCCQKLVYKDFNYFFGNTNYCPCYHPCKNNALYAQWRSLSAHPCVCCYICLFVCTSVCLSAHLSVCLHICLFVCASICLCILSVYPSCLSISVYLSCLSVCLSILSCSLVGMFFGSSVNLLSIVSL